MVNQSLMITPTRNTDLPLISGNFASIPEALNYAAKGKTGVNFFNNSGELAQTLCYDAIQHQALKTAVYFRQQKIPRLTRVAVIAETHSEFLITFFACQYSGFVPVPLPFSIYMGGKDSYRHNISHMLKVSQASILICPENLRALFVHESAALIIFSFTQLAQIRQNISTTAEIQAAQQTKLTHDDPAYIQFSSGSTAVPKGIVVSQQALQANISAILTQGMKLNDHDRAFSWLPFYHDMGLVGFILAALYGQRSVDYLAPSAFIRRPTLWLELISKNRNTITYAPAFGYRLVMQRHKAEQHLDLSCLKIAGIGGDMIDPELLALFTHHFGVAGFASQAFLPSYGMAEATLAISMGTAGQTTAIHTLADSDHPAASQSRVSCGTPLPNVDIAIFDAQQNKCPERIIGEIGIKGPSIATTYLTGPVETNATGYMRTGDLGYLHHGELFITGRIKDLIIIRGRNIWAQDIEWQLIRSLPALRQGDVAAIGFTNADIEKLFVFIQCRTSTTQSKLELKQAAQTIINQSAGVEATIILVTPGSLPVTSSGKLARAILKQRFHNHQLNIIN